MGRAPPQASPPPRPAQPLCFRESYQAMLAYHTTAVWGHDILQVWATIGLVKWSIDSQTSLIRSNLLAYKQIYFEYESHRNFFVTKTMVSLGEDLRILGWGEGLSINGYLPPSPHNGQPCSTWLCVNLFDSAWQCLAMSDSVQVWSQ